MLTFVLDCIPRIAIALVPALLFVTLFDKALKKHAGVFYALTAVVVIAQYWYAPFSWVARSGGAEMPAWIQSYHEWSHSFSHADANALGYLIRTAFFSAEASVALYTVVMFIGALPKTPWVKRMFAIRSELSILAGINAFGHGFQRVGTALRYWNADLSMAHGPQWIEVLDIIIFGVIFVVLTIAFLIAWVTSFKPVRRKLGSKWKPVQRATAYPFYVLVMLAGALVGLSNVCSGVAAFAEGTEVVSGQLETFPTWIIQGAGTFWIFLLIGVTYLVLRINKARADRAAAQERTEKQQVVASAVEP